MKLLICVLLFIEAVNLVASEESKDKKNFTIETRWRGNHDYYDYGGGSGRVPGPEDYPNYGRRPDYEDDWGFENDYYPPHHRPRPEYGHNNPNYHNDHMGHGHGGRRPSRGGGACFAEHNEIRQRHGKQPLQEDHRLVAAAQRHNEVMIRQNCFQHQCPGEPDIGGRVRQAGYQFSRAGENIAWGYQSCQIAMQQWMNSPGHRRNILGDFQHVGCHHNPTRNHYTCVFATPSNSNHFW